ncbi:MAG: HAD family phosphatase [Deltaproteobacteria bacterium]|nr:HAD family phosphatase [Deltaproteobacteria bacterium]
MRITTLISDLGGVLLDFDNRLYEERLVMCTGRPLEEVRTVLAEGLLEDLHLGRLNAEQFHRALGLRLGLSISLPELRELYSDIFVPRQDTVDLLRDLAPRCRLCLLSNTNEIHWTWCRAKYPFLDLFSHHVLSHEVGAAKPDPAIYRRALKVLGEEPSSCVFFDDVWVYADTATALGLHGITFHSAAQIEHDLARLGVTR